jgi:hypothetical protein
MVDRADLWLRVSPWPCLTSPVLIGSPSPSHPTVRAGFPPTALRQSSCPGLHRGLLVPDHPAAPGDDAFGVQGTLWRALPSKPTAFPATGQGASQAYLDAALQGPQGLAGRGVASVVAPPPHHLMHRRHTCLRRHRGALFGEGLSAPSPAAWRRFPGQDVDRILSAGGAASLHAGEPEEGKALRPWREAGLGAIARSSPPSRHRGQRLKGLLCTFATDEDGI